MNILFTNKMKSTKLVSIITASALLCSYMIFAGGNVEANTSGFKAGRIIDDSVFFNSGSMSVNQIQSFLDSKIPNCDTNGNQNISYRYNADPIRINHPDYPNDPMVTTSRAVYGERVSLRDGESRGSRAPYACINTKTYNTTNIAPESGLCSGYTGVNNETSAQIIYKVAQSCGINPQVLIVLLQKEQSLITDTWPWGIQYDRATGFSCPDPPPGEPLSCSPEYVGFFRQVYYAARRFKTYAANPGSFNYRAGRNNFIWYNPDETCGGSNVFIQNQATANLYIYTPYQPNPATLAAPAGQTVTCGAYGNLNFWRMFNDWFGATTSDSSTDILSFLRLNHGSGKVEVLGLPSIGSYGYISRSDFSSYPAVPANGAVVPLAKPNGELSFVRLNHKSGNTEIVTYWPQGGYTQLKSIDITSYPAVATDGAVKPIFWLNGDLVFIRLNHSSGNVELVSYSASSGYKKLAHYKITPYPAVPADGSVIPLFKPNNGELSFIRLNHHSGNVEIVSYGGNYSKLTEIRKIPYPAVPADGSVIPLFKPNGDLSFVRLNHKSGKSEVVTFSASSNYQQLVEIKLTDYPAVTPDGAVIPFFTSK